MKVRTIPPRGGGRPRGRPPPERRLLLDPPLVDVVRGAERGRCEVLQGLLRDREDVVGVAEVVRLVLVEDLVEGLVLLLPRRGRAVAVRRVATLFDGLVHGGVLEAGETEAGGPLGGVRDLARVP